MKKILVVGIIVGSILGLLFLCKMTNRYTKPCKIWECEAGLITVEDNTGNLWQFEDNNNYLNYHKGDIVIITFDSQDTEEIYDDEIIRVALQ